MNVKVVHLGIQMVYEHDMSIKLFRYKEHTHLLIKQQSSQQNGGEFRKTKIVDTRADDAHVFASPSSFWKENSATENRREETRD